MQVFVASLEQCLKAKNWPAALCLALTLPEMAGAVDSPESAAPQRYAQWFDKWVGVKYRTRLLSGQQALFSGFDCYALRCAMLYQEQDPEAGRRRYVTDALDRFQFTQVAEEHCMHKNRALQLHADRFCRDVAEGCEAWLKSIKNDASKSAVLKRGLNMTMPSRAACQ